MRPSCPIQRFLTGLCCCLGLCCFSKVYAQSLSLPLGKATATISSSAKKSNASSIFSFGKSLRFTYALGDRHALTLGTEYFDFGSQDGYKIEGVMQQKDTWKYRAVPIQVGYEYTLTDPNRRIVPVVGAAVAYQFSYAREIVDYREGMFGGVRPVYDKRYGMGFGGQLSFALRANVSRSMFLQAQSRLCYVDGLAFTSREDFGTRFSKVDFSIGAGFRL